LLGLDMSEDTIVVADFEAGIGTLTRLGETKVDAVVVVAEATAKSLEVAARATALAGDLTSGPVLVVANRVSSDAEIEAVRAALPGRTVVMVPEDPAIPAADRADRAPLDAAPHAPAVTALVSVADLLLHR
jgi:CO dehydrogenase maturation factor